MSLPTANCATSFARPSTTIAGMTKTWFWKRPTVDNHQRMLDEFAQSAVLQEHASLRSEILASYGYAQSIVRWTLATFVAITAAGLVAVNNANTTQNMLLFHIVLTIFGGAIPGIVWLSAWTWLGELYRAERAGSYLRRLEHDLTNVNGVARSLGFAPLGWETFIWANRERRTLWGKQTLTYLGTAGVFFGSVFGSLLIFGVLLAQLAESGMLPWWWGVTSVAGALLITIVGVAVSFVIYRRLMRLGRAVAPAT